MFKLDKLIFNTFEGYHPRLKKGLQSSFDSFSSNLVNAQIIPIFIYLQLYGSSDQYC